MNQIHDAFDAGLERRVAYYMYLFFFCFESRQTAIPQGGPPNRKADINPITLDTNIRFNDVGGLESHIDCLKEMVVFPMMYPDVFDRFHITPPKGVLFHGPPGTRILTNILYDSIFI